jgi:putative endonuclease
VVFWQKLWARLRRPWRQPDVDSEGAQARGAAGERAAEAHLRAQGLRVLARNWRNPADRREEIDLVCQDGAALVFVEVKTRAATALVSGAHAVDRRKRRALRAACAAYLRRVRPAPRTWRFDVVEVAWPAPGEARPPLVRNFADAALFRDPRAHRHN